MENSAGTRVRAKRSVLVNYRHHKGMAEIQKGWSGTVDEVIGDTAVVRFDRLSESVSMMIINLEAEDNFEGPHE